MTDRLDGLRTSSSLLRDIILGGQDGLVNVLGVVLGVAAATASAKIILISGLAATFAESLSMGAVAYTSSKAVRDFYRSQENNVAAQSEKPVWDSIVVGLSSFAGSFVPLMPFVFLKPSPDGVITCVVVSLSALFLLGAYKAKMTTGRPLKAGLEMAAIGGGAALAGYAIGNILAKLF